MESENLTKLKSLSKVIEPMLLEHARLLTSLDEVERDEYFKHMESGHERVEFIKGLKETFDKSKMIEKLKSIPTNLGEEGGSNAVLDTLKQKGMEVFGRDIMNQVFFEACKKNGGWFDPIADPEKAFRLMMPIAVKMIFSNDDMLDAMVDAASKTPSYQRDFEIMKEARIQTPFKTWKSYPADTASGKKEEKEQEKEEGEEEEEGQQK